MLGSNFTDDVRVALALSREEAARLQRGYVGPEHILLGLIARGGPADRRDAAALVVLGNLGVNADELRRRVEQLADRVSATTGVSGPDLPYTGRAKRVLELASREARSLRHGYLGTEHILLGLLDQDAGVAVEALTEAGVTRERVLAETLRVLGDGIAAGPQLADEAAGDTAIDDDWGRVTERARRAIDVARSEAARRLARSVGTEHLLIGLIADHDGAAATVLDRLGVERDRVRSSVRSSGDRAMQVMGSISRILRSTPLPQERPYSSAVQRVIHLAREDARARGQEVLASDHMLVGLLSEGRSLGPRLLAAEGVTLQSVLTERERLTG